MKVIAAPHLPTRSMYRHMCGVWGAVFLGLASAGAALGCTVAPHEATQMPESVSSPWPGPGGSLTWYDGPTTRYAHGVLGDAIEGTRLHAYAAGAITPCGDQSVELPAELVFEDTAPRLTDLDGDGTPEIIAVQSHQRLGAQLAIYGFSDDGEGLDQITATPFIGRSNRWLAPIGAADLDGDGAMEIAYIDRPHLARTLRVWRYEDGTLTEVAALAGLTNHRIGEDFISSGIRTCGTVPEIITASADWSRLISTTLTGGTLTARDLGAYSASALRATLNCGP